MRILQLIFSDPESSDITLFTHPTATEKRFQNDVKSIIKKHGEEFIKSHKSTEEIRTYTWPNFIAKKLHEMGYKYVPFKGMVFHWMSSFEKLSYYANVWEQWRAILGDELMAKVQEHNKKVGSVNAVLHDMGG